MDFTLYRCIQGEIKFNQISWFIFYTTGVISSCTWCRHCIQRSDKCNITNKTSHENNDRWYTKLRSNKGSLNFYFISQIIRQQIVWSHKFIRKISSSLCYKYLDYFIIQIGLAWYSRQTFWQFIHDCYQHFENCWRLNDGKWCMLLIRWTLADFAVCSWNHF